MDGGGLLVCAYVQSRVVCACVQSRVVCAYVQSRVICAYVQSNVVCAYVQSRVFCAYVQSRWFVPTCRVRVWYRVKPLSYGIVLSHYIMSWHARFLYSCFKIVFYARVSCEMQVCTQDLRHLGDALTNCGQLRDTLGIGSLHAQATHRRTHNAMTQCNDTLVLCAYNLRLTAGAGINKLGDALTTCCPMREILGIEYLHAQATVHAMNHLRSMHTV